MRRVLFRFLALMVCVGPVFAVTPLAAQQVTLAGLRSLNHAGAFRGLRQDAAGNVYTLFNGNDGVRLQKYSADGAQLLGEAHVGSQGDAGVALDVDAAGNVYVAGTSFSQGSVAGTTGVAFPTRSGSSENSFVAKFSAALVEQWLTFCGSPATAVTGVAVTATSVLVTGSTFAQALPVTDGGVQQAPAPNSSGDGFVENFAAADGTLRYATYLTGANGATSPAAIAVDAGGNAYVAGTTTATGYPTVNALVPVFGDASGNGVTGFVTKLDAAGDGFMFSTFVPGNGLTSIALDGSGGGSLLVSGDVSSGLFPVTEMQTPVASLVGYQTLVRMALDGSAVTASTMVAAGTESVVAAGPSGTAWVFGSAPLSGSAPLLPITPLETMGNAFAARVAANGLVDRVTRIGGLPTANSGFASMPVNEGGVMVGADGGVTLVGAVAPTLSSALLPTEAYDFPLVAAPNAALPSAVRDALPLSSCNGSACAGSAGLMEKLAPDAAAPSLALAVDALPNVVLRNLGTVAASGLQVTANGFAVMSGCGSLLEAGAECPLFLMGSGPGSVTVQAANAAAWTTALPSATADAQAVSVLPRTVDFGIQTAASAAGTRTLTVWNLSGTTQTFVSQNMAATLTSGAPVSTYALHESGSTCTPASDGTGKVLGPGGTCTITLSLAASSTEANDGPVNAHWNVGGNDVLVTGYQQAAALTLSASTVDFGRQFAGGLRAPRYLYLSNGSDEALTHGAVTSSNAVFAVTDECPAALQPRSVCRIALGYAAAGAPESDAMTLAVDGLTAQVLGETLPQTALTGAAVNPNLQLSATSVTFANPVVVTTASGETQTVTVTNSGAAAFSLGLSLAGDFAESTDCGVMLNAGAHCTVVVQFTPTAAGLRQGLLGVTAGAGSAAYVGLSGTGTAILPQANAVAFGGVPLRTPSVQWLKVSQAFVSLTAMSQDPNYRLLLVEDTGFGHGQPGPGLFSATATGSCLNCWLGVQFLPTDAGTHAGTIALTSPGGGMAASLAVTGDGVPLTGVILTPLSADFGSVAVHSASGSTVFQMTNGTSAALTVSTIEATGDFAVVQEATGGADCAGATVAVGASCFVAVRFVPGAMGSRAGTLSVLTSSGLGTAALNGIGSDDPGIAFAPGSLRFANVPGDGSTRQVVTITNTGSVAATIGAASVDDAQFGVSGNCGVLAAGASCVETVTFAAGASIVDASVTVPVTTAPAGVAVTTNYVLPLHGGYTQETAGLQIVPGEDAAVNFGASATGLPATTRVLHVNNNTATAMAVMVSGPREFAVTGSTCDSLAAGAGCDLTVTYTPLTAGNTTGTVLLQGTPADGSATRDGLAYVEGYGTGGGTLQVTGDISPTGLISFGQVASGSNAVETVTLTNPNTAAAGSVVTVRRVMAEFPFAATTNCGAGLAVGQSCTVTLTYAPVFQTSSTGAVTPQVDTGVLTIESDAAGSPVFVDLTGSAASAVVSSPNNSTPVAAFTTSQGSLVFPLTAVGSASTAQALQVVNTGTKVLHVTGFVASAGFTETSDCGTLVAGGACNVQVAFAPQVAGTTAGSLEIQSDSSVALEFVSLLGSAAPASVSLTPQSLDFGAVLVGASRRLAATLTNTGTTPVTLGAVTVGGSGFAAGVGSSCAGAGGVLAAGASCSIAVVFTPGSAGTLRGTLSVGSTATALPLTVALSGVGSQPQLSVAPAQLSFGTVAVGNSTTLSLTLTNGSAAAVNGLRFSASPADFAVTSTCGIVTLQAGSSCSVSVTYTPMAAGALAGALTIASSDPASPLTVPLMATAVQSGGFTLQVNGASAATVTVTSGVQASYNLTVTPTAGYSGTVALTCTADTVIQYGFCSVSPANVTLANGSQSATVTITTLTQLNASARVGSVLGRGVVLCLGPLALMAGMVRRRRVAGLLVVGMFVALCQGCGGGNNPNLRYVAPGTYRFHVSGASTNSFPGSQSVSLTLVVNPR